MIIIVTLFVIKILLRWDCSSMLRYIVIYCDAL